MVKRNWLLALTIILSSVVAYIIGKDHGWTEAFRELTNSSACKMTKRKYYNQIR
ncbi:MAG: hypothetical protein IJZ79_01740 [Bacilli bacterium]|nr:hypothetical protein [Bacilli bacterium]